MVTRVARPMARGRQRRAFLFGPLSTLALEMKSASRSCWAFFTLAFATALSISLWRTGAPAFVVNWSSWSASAASLPRTRLAIIRALRGEMRAYIALALAIIVRPLEEANGGMTAPRGGWPASYDQPPASHEPTGGAGRCFRARRTSLVVRDGVSRRYASDLNAWLGVPLGKTRTLLVRQRERGCSKAGKGHARFFFEYRAFSGFRAGIFAMAGAGNAAVCA